MQDIQPYICHIEDCDAPAVTYSTRLDLFRHWSQHHHSSIGSTWYTCTLCGGRLLDPMTVLCHQKQFHAMIDFSKTAKIKNGIIVEDRSGFLDRSWVPEFPSCDHGFAKCFASGRPKPCGNARLRLLEGWSFDHRYEQKLEVDKPAWLTID